MSEWKEGSVQFSHFSLILMQQLGRICAIAAPAEVINLKPGNKLFAD